MEDFLVDLLRVAELAPVVGQPFQGQGRPVPAEHDAVLQAAADLLLQRGREIFRRPAVQLVSDVSLVQQDRDHLVLPRPGRAAGEDFQLRIARRHPVDMARVAVVEHDAHAAGHALTDAGQAGHQQDRNVRLDRELVERVPDRVAGRIAQTVLALAEAEESGAAAGKPLELADPEVLHGRIDGEPVAMDDVAILSREGGGVVVGGADLVLVRHAPGAIDVEDGADVARAKRLRHLLLGLEFALALEDALRVLVLLHGAVMQARARREMGMAIEIAHVGDPLAPRHSRGSAQFRSPRAPMKIYFFS